MLTRASNRLTVTRKLGAVFGSMQLSLPRDFRLRVNPDCRWREEQCKEAQGQSLGEFHWIVQEAGA